MNKQDSIIATAIAIKKDGGCGRVDEMLRKKYPDSSYARQERPASKQTVDVKARTVDSAISIKNDGCGKGMVGFQGRCIRARNALAGVAAIGATAVGGGLYLHNRQKQQKSADFKNRFAEEVKKKRRELNTKRVQERRSKLKEAAGESLLAVESSRNFANKEIERGKKPRHIWRKRAGEEIARKASELRASGNYDSLIATSIAMRMDRGCGKRMKGEGGKCVPAGSRLAQGMNNAVSSGDWSAAQKFGGQIVANKNRLAQARRKKFRQSAGNAFRGTASALNRSADVIQKTAATAIAAKTLHELSKRNQEKKDSYIATTTAIKKDGGCGRGMVGFQGRCIRAKKALGVTTGALTVGAMVGGTAMALNSHRKLSKQRKEEKDYIQEAGSYAEEAKRNREQNVNQLNKQGSELSQKAQASADRMQSLIDDLEKKSKGKQDSLIATTIAMRMDWCKKGTVGNGRGQCVPTQQKQSKVNKWMGRAVGGALLASPIVAPAAGYLALRQMDKKREQTYKDLNNARSELSKTLNSPAGKTTFRGRS